MSTTTAASYKYMQMQDIQPGTVIATESGNQRVSFSTVHPTGRTSFHTRSGKYIWCGYPRDKVLVKAGR